MWFVYSSAHVLSKLSVIRPGVCVLCKTIYTYSIHYCGLTNTAACGRTGLMFANIQQYKHLLL